MTAILPVVLESLERHIYLQLSLSNPLLKLRLLILNGDWETYWNERQEQLANMLINTPKKDASIAM